MAKQKQKKHEAAEATVDSGKMGRKEFEKELAKLQVELTRLQAWVQAEGARIIVVFEGRDTAGKGGGDQPDHRPHESPRLPARGITRTLRPREDPSLHAALRRAFPGGRRDHSL